MSCIRFFNGFTKITAFPVQWLCFRTKVYYEDKNAQGRKIKGPALLVSNHRSVYDYAVYLFVFISRTLRVVMAEILFEKPLLGWFLKRLGGIRVNRNTHDFAFLDEAEKILSDGGVVGIFPEGRLAKPGETMPLPFSDSAALLALNSGVPVIPLYTNGSYFRKERARVIIGKPLYAEDLLEPGLSEKENVALVTKKLREKVIQLGEKLDELAVL